MESGFDLVGFLGILFVFKRSDMIRMRFRFFEILYVLCFLFECKEGWVVVLC